MRARLLSLAAGVSFGCSIGVSTDASLSSIPVACNTSDDCRPLGMVCAAQVCRVSQLSIPHVLVDVSIPASSTNAGQYSGMSFVLPFNVPTLGKADIVLPELGQLEFYSSFAKLANVASCDYAQSSGGISAVRVEATHRWPVDGVERTVLATNVLPAIFPAVPAGSGYTYEVYISVTSSDRACQLPPVLVRDVGVSANRALTLAWPAPRSVALDVQIQSGGPATTTDLAGWQLDVVDPIEGRQLANPETLGTPIADTSAPTLLHYRATVKYNPILSADSSPPVGTEIIRLQPPHGAAQPTYYVSMSGLTLFAPTTEAPLPINAIPASVTIGGRVETADSAQPLQAPIAFISTGFSVSNSGIMAEYSTSTQSDANGQFQVALPAGQYRVLVVPPGDGKHAVLDTTWSVQGMPSTQAGRLLQIPVYSEIRGRIDSSLHLSASESATIEASPSSSLLYDQVSQTVAIRNTSPGARAASMLFQPQSNAEFSLPVDTGQFDVALHSPQGLPWLVSPGHEIVPARNTLPVWSMPIGVPWSGSLRVPANDLATSPNAQAIPRAILKIYALVKDKAAVRTPNEAQAIVQIGEGRTLADGSFQLELPDQFQL